MLELRALARNGQGFLAMKLQTLKNRAEFLRLRGGTRWACDCFALETKPRDPAARDGITGPRFGFTVTKAMGNAVVRNRMRRRLKAAVQAMDENAARANHDYVLIARAAAHAREFSQLKKALEQALQRVHHPRPEKVRDKPSV